MEQKSKQMELDKVNHYNNVNEAKGNNKYILKAINDLQELKILKLGVSKINYANQAFVVYVSNRKFVKQNIQQSIHCWEMKEDELLSFVYLC